ncbi:DNA polymerase IV [Mycoplasma zalophidermidis]|uniref:Y-family DNA polymerase n=1 Tax=Mycoplasma zalophidermidis TaxID=398174 RepID=UPI001C119706|nr:DNA polymerase IV [Mycoplasma zalophidermidis]MBU4689466.1 DNA polymerase IV [Mycoplasma zalophidermidis]
MSRIIFHIDFDSYFASAHRVLNPQYDGKPIAIGKNLKRSIACSVSYELKAKGVKSGWPNYKILEKEPRTIFIEPNFDLYINLSNKIFDFLGENYTKNIEVYSIDECWVDVTNITNENNAVNLAKSMQKHVYSKFRIPISIGISHNKFLAKLSTNLAKPFGVKQTKIIDIKDSIWPLAIDEYFGIGKSTSQKLKEIGIDTIGKLASRDKNDQDLYEIFRSRTNRFINEAKGIFNEELNYEHNDLKSIGNELTFLSFDLDERDEILKILFNLCQKVSLRAKNRNTVGYVICVSVRSTTKRWTRQQMTLNIPTNDSDEIYSKASSIFNKMFKENFIRGIGVKLSRLINEFDVAKPISLFETDEHEDKIKKIIKNINYKMRVKSLKTGDEFESDKVKENIQSRYLCEDTAKKG